MELRTAWEMVKIQAEAQALYTVGMPRTCPAHWPQTAKTSLKMTAGDGVLMEGGA